MARTFDFPAFVSDGSGSITIESSEVSSSEDELSDFVRTGCFLLLAGTVVTDALGGGVVHIEDFSLFVV